MILVGTAVAFLAVGALLLGLLPRITRRPAVAPSTILVGWIAVVTVAGLLLPALVIGSGLMFDYPAVAASALLLGLLIQIATEQVLSQRGRSELRAHTGLCFTVARCAQLLLLWTGSASGPDAAVLVVATVVWPVNLLVLVTVVSRRRGGAPVGG